MKWRGSYAEEGREVFVWRFIATVRVAHVKFLCGDFLGDVKVLLCACE